MVAGDCNIGLNDLVVPYETITGFRVSGLLGVPSSGRKDDRTNLGLNQAIFQNRVFEGTAKIGSKVEIFINDRLVDSTEVLTGNDRSPMGMGIWRFDNVSLAGSDMNQVRIAVTDLSGSKTQLNQAILGTPLLFPKGKASYTAAFGRNRNMSGSPYMRGLMSGGHVKYGLTSTLTIGGALAAYNGFYVPLDTFDLNQNGRDYPVSGANAGLDFAWQPFTSLMVSGGAARSLSKWHASTQPGNDTAMQLRGDLYISKTAKMNMRIFRYGPNFFSGQTQQLYDRKGYTLDLLMNPWLGYQLDLAMGTVANNLSGTLTNGKSYQFQHAALHGNVFRNTSAGIALDRLSGGLTGESLHMMTTLSMSTVLGKDIRFDGVTALGKALATGSSVDFFTGLSLPAIDLYSSPRTIMSILKPVSLQHFLGLSYVEGNSVRLLTLVHGFKPGQTARANRGLDVFTEIGRDFYNREMFFQSRIEYPMPMLGGARVGLTSQFFRGSWKVMLATDMSNLYGLYRSHLQPITARHIDPNYGAVHGCVFLDYNGNGKRDPGEPGLANIRVYCGSRQSVLTDRNGYYVLPSTSRLYKERVYLDINTVPATYSPTHAIQTAYVNPGNLTEIDLGVTPTQSVTGLVELITPNAGSVPLSGVRVVLLQLDGKEVTDSITAQDGSYYLGEARPGKYLLHLDKDTLPKDCAQEKDLTPIDVIASKDTQEMKVPAIKVTFVQPLIHKL